jgi:hypothetical protein
MDNLKITEDEEKKDSKEESKGTATTGGQGSINHLHGDVVSFN